MDALILISILAVSFSAVIDASDKQAPRLEWYVPDRQVSETLAKLAVASGKNPEAYRIYRRERNWSAFSDKGFVTTIDVRGATYAIAVQEVVPRSVPGMSAQQVVLLSEKGEILDRVQCDINSRYGRTKTEILPKPEADGAQIIIRFVGRKLPSGKQAWWHNQHTIVHEGKSRTYYQKNTDKPDIWDEKGLCRIKVADRKLVVLFPDPSGKGGITPLRVTDEKP